ncbi:MAG TPA: hypothetical protein VEJ18_15320 [Planctomycetota bacterium]|nr:hypothetical protein [Planctomycetota bacterium]
MSELDEIRRKYESGQLDAMRDDLAQFIVAHRSRIAAFRADEEARGVPLDDETAVKLYLIHLRSINPRKEIQEQLEEIRKETWIRGINTGCQPDPEAVANDWARQYSAAWRSHRLTTIVYVFEREKDRYLKLLQC